MDISIHGPVDPNGIWLGKELGFAVCTNEAAEDLIARFDLDWMASVVDGRRYGRLAIGAEGSVEPNAFHCVVQELVVCLGAFDFGPSVDFKEVHFAFVG